MIIKLSKRLQQIADWVPMNSRLADIGSDHALLPTYLAKEKRIVKAIAGEVNPGPFDAAVRQVKGSRLESMIEVRRGDGLAVVQAGEVDCITIAGMGGGLIVSILQAGVDKLSGVQRLVLQPNVGEDLVRQWLRDEQWLLKAEHILEEDGKIYEVLLAERPVDGWNADEFVQADKAMYASRQLACGFVLDEQWLLKLGPYLSEEVVSDVFIAKWQHEVNKQERILSTMAKSDAEETAERREQFVAYKSELEELIACWQKGKQ
ncbi:class I SAM-dependent methyltransferase [Paenibacillus sp. SC116]|uniref:tRNA (adenine(22)-N(1))-methyltransferase n=1 Tax=Paenibacillus sp. SC116 TaxID=2968986 RepID=UPI00215AF026|nr:class I SAM-dependent methyltransferase [Paenibacillus sp. SC116]MCR8845781.1 class I SAM-dependent methyltransferase [Paenibacillus sp. SC116]